MYPAIMTRLNTTFVDALAMRLAEQEQVRDSARQ
jgi:hypothetical protein